MSATALLAALAVISPARGEQSAREQDAAGPTAAEQQAHAAPVANAPETAPPSAPEPAANAPAPVKEMQPEEIVIVGAVKRSRPAPAVVQSQAAEDIAHLHAENAADVFRYVPNVNVRKIQGGNINQPLAMRGSTSTTAAPRTLVLVDGIPISNYLTGGMGDSPRWQMVSAAETERVDVIYGPFSAAYGGNSFGGTVLFTTRMPEQREIRVSAGYSLHKYSEQATQVDLGRLTANASFGDRVGRFSYLVWYDRLSGADQPISYLTLAPSAAGASNGGSASGWRSELDPQGNPWYVLGAQGNQEFANNTLKAKLAYEVTADSQLRFSLAFWDSATRRDSPETYLRDASGAPIYSGNVDIDGKGFTLAPNAFSYSKAKKQDVLYGLTYSLASSSGLKVSAALSYYDALKDVTQTSTAAAETSAHGGAGTVVDRTSGAFNSNLAASKAAQWLGKHTLGAGYHFNHSHLDAETWNASDWEIGVRTALSKAEHGTTRTHAVFVDDAWDVFHFWSVYLGGRYEWWKGLGASKATDGASGRVVAALPDKSANAFSPKLSTTLSAAGWSVRGSLGWATRFPTVGELYYGGINSSGLITNGNPDLKPEKSFAKDVTVSRGIGSAGEVRLTYFHDDVTDTIFSQTNVYTNVMNYQNVQRVRTQGVELGGQVRRLLIDGLGISGSIGWNDSKTLRNDAVPASVGKVFPRVPKWRAKLTLDYAPSERWFVSLGGNHSSKPFYQLDNSDTLGGYGGMDSFWVLDARASMRLSRFVTATAGVDNITNALYHEYHPFPRRSIYGDLKCTF
jgi:iron complex outermembrane receptor protein